jgi:thiol peroxidase
MADERTVTLKGNPITLGGAAVAAGDDAPDFEAVDTSLQTVHLSDAKGKVIILSAVPSLDTPVCDTETRRFNSEASGLSDDIEVWTISMDLPFAQKRWCAGAGIDRVKALSDYRTREFGENYGVRIESGPLKGVTARAVFVVGRDGKLKHVEYVNEIASEPDYEAAITAAKEAAQA